ncbi:MAG: 6,7-dimethyl-8-ribityllumazine synthase [Dehalococcoidia bacterium]|nr:6,7-dimethyl-8-ribityllumazine synthase [Dehalococcoidia bacterium]
MQPARLEGGTDGRGLRIAIVVARFNQHVTDGLLDGALEALAECGVPESSVTVAGVPGSFELTTAAAALARSGDYDAIVCLGAIIKHETRHDEFIAVAVANGLTRVAVEIGVPVTFGVLTTENEAQAIARSSGYGNRGPDAARGAVEMANLVRLAGRR